MTARPLTMASVLDWLEGRLDAERSARVEEAIAVGGPEASDLVGWAEEFLASARAMPLAEPPADLSQRLRDTFRLAQGTTDDGARGRLAADSRVAAGMRSGATDTRHQLVFRTDLGTVVLDLAESGSELDVEGSISRPPGQPLVSVACSRGGRTIRTTVADRDGLFSISEAPIDIDELVLFAGDAPVRIRLPR